MKPRRWPMSSINPSPHLRKLPFKPALPPAPRKRPRDRSAKQQALIAAARKLFANQGYEATTTREIAAAAGCAEGLIHRYFKGKAGLLSAIIESRISKEVMDLHHDLQPAPTLEQEFLQLVDWEVDRLWEDQDFLRVAIPRAILDPAVRKVMHHAVVSRRGQAMLKRLKHFKECQQLPAETIEALTQSVAVLGITFGFMRPIVLGQDHGQAKRIAASLAKLILGGL